MLEYKVYSSDIWEYLNDMPYMPSRRDRDELLELGDEIRVRIWDYFFRIKPEDVGKPQKKEIEEINIRLQDKILQHNKRQSELRDAIKLNLRIILIKRVKNSLFWIGLILVVSIIYNYFFSKGIDIMLNPSGYNYFIRSD